MDPAPLDSAGLLVGNSFPLSLVRRRVVIEPVAVETLRAALATKFVRSFWGHANTLAAVSRWLGSDLTPASERPALFCDAVTRLPMLDGEIFAECWVISPDYAPGFRPTLGVEVPPEKIPTWQVLRLTWA